MYSTTLVRNGKCRPTSSLATATMLESGKMRRCEGRRAGAWLAPHLTRAFGAPLFRRPFHISSCSCSAVDSGWPGAVAEPQAARQTKKRLFCPIAGPASASERSRPSHPHNATKAHHNWGKPRVSDWGPAAITVAGEWERPSVVVQERKRVAGLQMRVESVLLFCNPHILVLPSEGGHADPPFAFSPYNSVFSAGVFSIWPICDIINPMDGLWAK